MYQQPGSPEDKQTPETIEQFQEVNEGLEVGWSHSTPREALSPIFTIDGQVRYQGHRTLAIWGNGNTAACGFWSKRVPVRPGTYYRFQVTFRCDAIEDPNLTLVHSVLWRNCSSDVNCPQDHIEHFSQSGQWTVGEGIFRAPSGVSEAEMRLYYRWSAAGKVWWGYAALTESQAVAPRLVKVGVWAGGVPSKSTDRTEHLQFWENAIDTLSACGADLILLPETINLIGAGDVISMADVVPGGPFFDVLAASAAKHHAWVCGGLLERCRDLVYNSACLLDPAGRLAGLYRKTHLYWPEVLQGITPGNGLQVFDTRLGKVGVMICYDSWWPEVSHLLAAGGADIVLFPNAGYEPAIATARAIDNSLYLAISSLYGPASIIDPSGSSVVRTEKGGVVGLLDLSVKPQCHPNAGGSLNGAPGGRSATRNSLLPAESHRAEA